MTEKVIHIQGLHYTYPDGTAALSGIDWQVEEGQRWGVIGPNGAGKSTLLLHLNGLLRGDCRIEILGRTLEEKNLAWIRSQVGMVFQDPQQQLFMPTVFDDVAFGPLNMDLAKEEVEAAVEEALNKTDLLAAKARAAHHLSFGEKKRVSLATVLSMRPQILVLDEPTSNLDARHRMQLLSFLRDLKLTQIIATHDLSLVAEACSQVVILDQGRLVAQGRTEEILGNHPLLDSHGLR